MRSVGDQLRELFRSVRARALTVRNVLDNLPRLNRATVSKECLYLATLGILVAVMVESWGDGHRSHYEFHASPLLLSTKHLGSGIVSPRSCVLAVLKEAPGALTVVDLRYAINILFPVNLTKRAVQSAVDQLIESRKVTRDGGGSNKFQRYTIGRAASSPWRVLDSALRKVEAGRAGAR